MEGLIDAVEKVSQARSIHGTHPGYHLEQMQQLKRDWPTLWEALDELDAELKRYDVDLKAARRQGSRAAAVIASGGLKVYEAKLSNAHSALQEIIEHHVMINRRICRPVLESRTIQIAKRGLGQ